MLGGLPNCIHLRVRRRIVCAAHRIAGFGDDAETTTSDVTITAETTATGTVAATTADIATGLCVTAAGEADDAGGYDATSLALSDADENGECSTGFGGFPGGGAPGDMGQGDDE